MSTFALPLVSAPAMASQARACLPFPTPLLRLLRETRQSISPTSPSALPACRPVCTNKSLMSLLSLPLSLSGCRNKKRGPWRLTRHLSTSAQKSPPYSPHHCLLSRPKMRDQSGTCQSPQDQQALRHTGSRPRPSHPASVRVRNTRPAPEAWHQQDNQFQRSAVLVGFPCGQKKNTVRKFCDESFPNADFAFDVMFNKAGITHVSLSKPKLLVSSSSSRSLVWVAGILPTTRWQC